jgi:nucleoid-associated protein YgaU
MEPDPRATTGAGPEPRKQRTVESPDRPSKRVDIAMADWVTIPNTGKLPSDGGEPNAGRGADTGADADADTDPERPIARDPRAHAAKNVSFEQEPSLPRVSPRGARQQSGTAQRSTAGSGLEQQLKGGPQAGRVDSVPHIVERGENFWTISRLYYDSGRYHRALWKANSQKYPDISVLHVGDTIMIPPVEDLDPDYILPPRSQASSALPAAQPGQNRRGLANPRDETDESSESSAPISSRRPPASNARSNRGSSSTDAGLVRRSSRTDSELDLPVADSGFRPDQTFNRGGRRLDLADHDAGRDNGEPETRTAARPRTSASVSPRRPVYKVRQNDTVRSIARDTLDDSRRADEILELNRALVDDPNHLIVGQILELPDDARTTLRRSARRE